MAYDTYMVHWDRDTARCLIDAGEAWVFRPGRAPKTETWFSGVTAAKEEAKRLRAVLRNIRAPYVGKIEITGVNYT